MREPRLRLDARRRRLRFAGLVGPEPIEAHRAGLDWSRAVLLGQVADGAVRGLGDLLVTDAGGVRAG